MSVPPDLAQVDAGVTSDAKTAREASDANNAAMGKVLSALKGAGIEREGLPDLAAVVAAAICAEPPGTVAGRRLSRQQSRHDPRARCHQGRKRDRHAGRRRRQRHRRHQLHGVAGLEAARRRPHAGGCRCPPQGGDLRQGRRRHARRAAQHFGRRRRAAPGIPRQDGGSRWRPPRWHRAKRRFRSR